jgi:hypothetical protein
MPIISTVNYFCMREVIDFGEFMQVEGGAGCKSG